MEEVDVLEIVTEWIKEAKRIIVLTGSEVSMESGLPDFSDSRLNPHIRDFRENREVRAQYWSKIRNIYPTLAKARPNPAHEALAELEILGNLDCLLTLTTDGLHHRAGSSVVIELLSTVLWVTCTSCGKDYTLDQILNELDQGKDIPECNQCGNDILKPSISFPGQPLPHWEVREAWVRLRDCDLLLIVGASVDQPPVSSFPLQASQSGAKIVIITERQIQEDEYADAVLYGKASQVLPSLVKRLKEGMANA
jgi:NAD-dependent deacetylase